MEVLPWENPLALGRFTLSIFKRRWRSARGYEQHIALPYPPLMKTTSTSPVCPNDKTLVITVEINEFDVKILVILEISTYVLFLNALLMMGNKKNI